MCQWSHLPCALFAEMLVVECSSFGMTYDIIGLTVNSFLVKLESSTKNASFQDTGSFFTISQAQKCS